MSIFISIVSYRDPELLETINSLIENASNPDDLHFGIIVQDFEEKIPDLSKIKNSSVVKLEPKNSKGVGYARSLAMKLYKNQDYYLQIDSHMRFVENWDNLLIDELSKAKKISNNKKVILSSYPLPYTPGNPFTKKEYSKKDETTYTTRQSVRISINNEWVAGRILFKNTESELPEISGMVLGCFLFSYSDIIKEIPYDPEISFLGDEVCFSVRAWTRGWDIYSSKKTIAYHFYDRPKHSKIWEDKQILEESWDLLEKKSKDKQKNVLCGVEEGTFGVGKIRSLEEYENFIGYNFKKAYSLKKLTDYNVRVVGR
jgi:GT2 family glycosyltransferase